MVVLKLFLIIIFVSFLCLIFATSIYGGDDFTSFCSNHGNGRPLMTSISLKNQQSGVLISHDPANVTTQPFRRIACTWRLLFDDYISELDDLVPAPKSKDILENEQKPPPPIKTTKNRGFRMGASSVDDGFSVRLDVENFDIAETNYDPNEVDDTKVDDDSARRCERNFVKISYIDGHANKQFLGQFCGRVAIPPFFGDPGRSVVIEVEMYELPKSAFSIKFRAAKSTFDTHNKQCSPDYFACLNSGNEHGASRCVPEAYRCDSLSDCPNGVDEQGCKRAKPENEVEKPDPFEVMPVERVVVDSGCGSPRFQSGASGQLASLNFPRKYRDNLRCVWIIASEPGTKILFSFNKTFGIEPSETPGDCPYDALTLYPRGVNGLQFAERLCGAKAPPPRLIASSWLMVIFETDSSTVQPGFSVKWKSITASDEAQLPGAPKESRPPVQSPEPFSEDSCTSVSGITTSTPEGFISSPAYGSNYPSGMTCRWILQPRPKNTNDFNLTSIQFRFLDFSVQSSPQCNLDFVMIKYLDRDQKQQWVRYCNGANVPPFEEAISIETQSSAEVIFRSDSWLEERGFALSFRAVFSDSSKGKANSPALPDEDEEPLAKICGLAPTIRAPAAPIFKGSSPFLIGGPTFVENGALPWMVNLLFEKEHRCAGTLISDRWIVTAANCFQGQYRQMKLWQVVPPTSEAPPQIESIYIHPQYDSNGKGFDIALIKLRAKLNTADASNSSASLVPLCLASRDTRRLDRCFVFGWHESKAGRRDRLKQIQAPIVVNEKCRNRHLMYEALVTDNMLCAGYEIGSHQLCYAMLDGGSSLACLVNSKWELHGILSFGKGCAGSRAPDVYTRIYALSDWIQRVVAKLS